MLFYLKALTTFMPCHCATWQTCLHCQACVLDWNFWEERFVSFDKKKKRFCYCEFTTSRLVTSHIRLAVG